MGIHYDYKSTRGDKAMKKEAKRKARIEQRRAKRSSPGNKSSEEKMMHDIDNLISVHDLLETMENREEGSSGRFGWKLGDDIID